MARLRKARNSIPASAVDALPIDRLSTLVDRLSAVMRIALLALCLAALGAQAQQRVNVNTADAPTMASVLNGVGLKKAEAIVDYREANGRFNAPAELTKVKGIGAAIVARNEGKIAVSDADGDADGSSARADE